MNRPITTYAPIAKSLLVMDKSLQEKMGKKFDICYIIAKENMAFRKYPAIHELESRHGVELGQPKPSLISLRKANEVLLFNP